MDLKDIRTGNITANASIIPINRRLGFKKIQDDIIFKISLYELLEKLKKL